MNKSSFKVCLFFPFFVMTYRLHSSKYVDGFVQLKSIECLAKKKNDLEAWYQN